jgi:hypothetical protein
MLNVAMLSVVHVECCKNSIMLSLFMLRDVMLNVVAPLIFKSKVNSQYE